MTTVSPGAVIVIAWAAFLIVWLIGTFRTKRDVRPGNRRALSRLDPAVQRLVFAGAVLGLLAIVRIRSRTPVRLPTLFHPPLPLAWLAAVLTVAGIGFAICARIGLGRNWSPRPSIKEEHELVTTGPYRLVRHPIYAGMLLAAVGLVLSGSLYGPILLAGCVPTFLLRIRREEQIMDALFPAQYPAYRQRTRRLVPLLW